MEKFADHPWKNSSISKSYDRSKLETLISSSKSALNFFSFGTNSEISSSCVSNTYDPRKNSSISKTYDRTKLEKGRGSEGTTERGLPVDPAGVVGPTDRGLPEPPGVFGSGLPEPPGVFGSSLPPRLNE